MHVNNILAHAKFPEWREKFNSKIAKAGPDDCWEWQGALDTTTGYGLMSAVGIGQRSHRLAWVFANGAIPMLNKRRSMSVCHTCDNRKCCNPAHLWLGSDSENIRDCIAKGRLQRGAKHYRAKLTEDQVRAIRKDPRPSRVIGPEYGIRQGTVCWIRSGKGWKHVV